MKKIYSLLAAGLALMSVTSSCVDSDYDKRYNDPSKTESVGVPQVFTGIMFKGNVWMNLMYYRYFTQSTTSGLFSGVIGDSNTMGRFRGAGEGYYNNRWKDYYDMLTQYRLLEYTYQNLSEAEKPANLIFYYLGRTLVEAQLHEVISLWGDVPFFGAGTLWQNGDFDEAKKKCVYDDDVVLYKQILTDLKEVGDYFAGGADPTGLNALSRQDYSVAAGSKDIWQKYVNSLRLRIALHLSTNGDCTAEAHAAIKEILENPGKYPLIDSNQENMGVAADTKTDDFNYGKSLSQGLRTGDYATVSQTMLRVLNVPAVNGIPGEDTDPRLEVMCDCNPDGEYVTFDLTKDNTEIIEIEDRKRQEYISRGIVAANYYCEIDSQAVAGWDTYQGNENIVSPWITAAEVSLSKAEAYLMGYGVAKNEATAKENFVKGVQQSIEYYWDMKQTSSLFKNGNDSYKGFRELSAKPSDAESKAYAEKIWKPDQETVCEQLWLNFSFMNELEAWNVVRRTGYPEVTFRKDKQQSSFPTPPHRLPYPSDELSYNRENCQNAIDKNYDEPTGYYTQLFWAKKDYYVLLEE